MFGSMEIIPALPLTRLNGRIGAFQSRNKTIITAAINTKAKAMLLTRLFSSVRCAL